MQSNCVLSIFFTKEFPIWGSCLRPLFFYTISLHVLFIFMITKEFDDKYWAMRYATNGNRNRLLHHWYIGKSGSSVSLPVLRLQYSTYCFWKCFHNLWFWRLYNCTGSSAKMRFYSLRNQSSKKPFKPLWP